MVQFWDGRLDEVEVGLENKLLSSRCGVGMLQESTKVLWGKGSKDNAKK